MSSIVSSRGLILVGLGVLLATGAGCGSKAEDEEVLPPCETAANCGDPDEWDCIDGVCVEVDPDSDLCRNVTCPGAQTCDPETGDCVGTCCTANRCLNIPGSTCDEELCLTGENPCVIETCDPACGSNEVCNEVTLECEAACKHTRCEEIFLRCDQEEGSPTYGECVQRPISEGEIGWNCADDPDVCLEGTCVDFFSQDPNDPSGMAFCTQGCTDDTQCPVGAYCEPQLSYCWLACDESGYRDCPFGTQCVDGIGLSNAVCLGILPVGTCEGGDCVEEFGSCDPSTNDECERGLTCLSFTEGSGQCMQVDCQYLDQGCAGSNRCMGIGNNLYTCLEGCDPFEIDGCIGEGHACQPEARVDGPRDAFFFAHSEDECTSKGFTAHASPAGAEFAYTCHTPCSEEAPCPAGQFCTSMLMFEGGSPVSLCVNYAITSGTCPNACSGLGCSDLGGGTAVCYVPCESDAECDEDFGGRCARFGFTGGGSMTMCVYNTQGSYCFFGCEADSECGYCESDDDCPERRISQDVTRQLKCDHATNMCRMPVATDGQAAQFCRAGEARDPDGIEDADGNKSGACGIRCTYDVECAGACVDGFCLPVTSQCNAVSGQCESPCEAADTCLHDLCLDGRCAVGCTGEIDGECGASGLCLDDEEINYCIVDCNVAGCPEGTTCIEETGICVSEPAFTALMFDGVDLLEEGGATVVVGDVSVQWATENATGISRYLNEYDADDGCPAADDESWVADGALPPAGSDVVPVPGNACVKLVAEGEGGETELVFWIVTLPLIELEVLAAVTGPTGEIGILLDIPAELHQVVLEVRTGAVATLQVEVEYRDEAGEAVGEAEQLEFMVIDPVMERVHEFTPADGVARVVFTATATDAEGDENSAIAGADIADFDLVDCLRDEACEIGTFCNADFVCEVDPGPACTVDMQEEFCMDPEAPYCDEGAGECVAHCVVDENCSHFHDCVEGACVPVDPF